MPQRQVLKVTVEVTIQKVLEEAVGGGLPMRQTRGVNAEVVKVTDREPKVRMLKVAEEGSIQKVAVELEPTQAARRLRS